MKFKPGLILALLLAGAVASEAFATTESPEPRKLEAKNQKVDLSKFEALRLRHSIRLLPSATKAYFGDIQPKASRKLDGENVEEEQLGEALQNAESLEIKDQMISDIQASAQPLNIDLLQQSKEQEFYEEGTELFLAQEQKRILLLQFYEVILNNPNRNPQIDPRIIKLMTNYLQTLEYVYVKQIQHSEESPPVLYDFRSDNETAPFCDSPSVMLPDQKFLNEEDDYFVKLFDSYNARQLGVYMSPTQLKQQGLFRKLVLHLNQAKSAQESYAARMSKQRQAAWANSAVAARAGLVPQERNLKLKKQKAEAKDQNKKDVSMEAQPLGVIMPSYIDIEHGIVINPKIGEDDPNTKSGRQRKNSASEKSRKLQRRIPMEPNAGTTQESPIDDPFPIQNSNVYRENIHEDLMEILEFFGRQLNLIFERMERLNNLNRGLRRWAIRPHWRDFEQAVQYFHALASPANRFIDALDLIIRACGNQRGPGLMGHIYGHFHRIAALDRRGRNIENALSQSRIQLIQMQNNLSRLRHVASQAADDQKAAMNLQVNRQIMAVTNQQNIVNDLTRRMNVVTRYRNEQHSMAASYNQMGDGVAEDARAIRRAYVELELLARSIVTTTNVDLSKPRQQQMSLDVFEQTIPRMVVLKNDINRRIRIILPKMNRMLTTRDVITGYLDRYERQMTRRRRARKMKIKNSGKGLI